MLLNSKSDAVLDTIKTPGVYIVYGPGGIGKSSSIVETLGVNNVQIFGEEGSIGVEGIKYLTKQLKLKQWHKETVYILIKSAEKMTAAAQNAFLKTLEELPESVAVIMVTSDLYALLPTIRSRSQALYFPPPSKSEMIDWASEEFKDVDQGMLEAALVMSGYLPGRLVSILADEEVKEAVLERYQLIEQLLSGQPSSRLKAAKDLQEYLPEVLDEIVLYARYMLENDAGNQDWLEKSIATIKSSELMVTNVNKRYILDTVALANNHAGVVDGGN